MNIHMMAPATGHWIAVYQDENGKRSKAPIAAWALVQERGAKAIVGLVSGSHDGALVVADDRTGFVRYKKCKI